MFATHLDVRLESERTWKLESLVMVSSSLMRSYYDAFVEEVGVGLFLFLFKITLFDDLIGNKILNDAKVGLLILKGRNQEGGIEAKAKKKVEPKA